MMGDVVEQTLYNATGAELRTSWPPQWSINKGHTPIPTGSTQGQAKPSLLRRLLRRVLADTPDPIALGIPEYSVVHFLGFSRFLNSDSTSQGGWQQSQLSWSVEGPIAFLAC